MMSLLFGLLAGCLLIFFNCRYFFLVSNYLIFFIIYMLISEIVFTDSVMVSYDFFFDNLSYSLVILSLWITILMLQSSSGILFSNNSVIFFYLSVYFLMIVLVFCFFSLNLLSFYFFFEISLIPTLFIIMGWGYQPERLQAGVYFLFYTLSASLPLLVILIYFYKTLGTLDFFSWNCLDSSFVSFFLFLGMSLAFLVKMPMFFVHLWLPKAHVEAPVSGSMILAGVLLKLGGYGLYRVLGLSVGSLKVFGSYFYGLSILGMLYVGFMCCRLNDLKALVAYSSVAHMGMVICGIYSFYMWGYMGALLMMISHGLSSSGLFCAVNMYYERLGSRSLYLNSGLLLIIPVFTLLFFMLCASNMAAPPTINLLSEIFLMTSILKFDKIMLIVFPVGSFLGAVFTLFIFSYSQHGKFFSGNYSFTEVGMREYHLLSIHIIPVNFLILKVESFMLI
uniref:NADH-ubiquinone oxidoreductase chain 4 n=1 Tax=Dicranocentrus wangi TaxID=1302322 RepID=A0A6H0EWQ2_9HEXA|nr:NADH dehydrogenase subunit 4 [Dicranocentrus wangi]QIT06440.1 NADH dehydrogenase subunit 4 [Dicranocentrus wangi]